MDPTTLSLLHLRQQVTPPPAPCCRLLAAGAASSLLEEDSLKVQLPAILEPAGGAPAPALCGPCRHCKAATTPVWRLGPRHAAVLCNACGIMYAQRGYLEAPPPPAAAAEPAGPLPFSGPSPLQGPCSNCGAASAAAYHAGPSDLPVLCDACLPLLAAGHTYQGAKRKRREDCPTCLRCGAQERKSRWTDGGPDWPLLCRNCFPLIQRQRERQERLQQSQRQQQHQQNATGNEDEGDEDFTPYTSWRCCNMRRPRRRRSDGGEPPAAELCRHLNGPSSTACEKCRAPRYQRFQSYFYDYNSDNLRAEYVISV